MNPEPSTEAHHGSADEAEAEARDRAQAEVRRRFHLGLLAWAVGSVLLVLFTPLPLYQALGAAGFFLLFPALGFAQLPLLAIERLERIPVYVGSIISILGLGALGLVLGLVVQTPAEFGLVGLPLVDFVLWTVGLTLATFVVILLFRPVEVRHPGPHSEFLRTLLPRTGREKGVFAGLSLAAGVGEELAYRGYALQVVLLAGAGPWSAAILSSLPFGALHSYQGAIGVLRTGAIGFLLAVPVIVTGSLLPSMAAHALIDLLVGLVFGPRLMQGLPETIDQAAE